METNEFDEVNRERRRIVERGTDIDLALLKQWKSSVEEDLKETKQAIQALQDERTKALKWGIATLGAAVLAMGSWMWTYVSSHLK